LQNQWCKEKCSRTLMTLEAFECSPANADDLSNHQFFRNWGTKSVIVCKSRPKRHMCASLEIDSRKIYVHQPWAKHKYLSQQPVLTTISPPTSIWILNSKKQDMGTHGAEPCRVFPNLNSLKICREVLHSSKRQSGIPMFQHFENQVQDLHV
jgi:hypothetical protein